MLCQRIRMHGAMDASKHRKTAVIVAGMWKALGQASVLFQRHRGEVGAHVMDRHPEGTAVGTVDQIEGDTNTASLSARAAAASVLLLQCRPTNGCKWSVPCVLSMRRTKRPYYFAR
jgi:hypothetical protein